MTFRQMNAKYYEPAAQWTMNFGVIFLCQTWIEVLDRYGLTIIIIINLVAFLVTSQIPPEPEAEAEEEEELV